MLVGSAIYDSGKELGTEENLRVLSQGTLLLPCAIASRPQEHASLREVAAIAPVVLLGTIVGTSVSLGGPAGSWLRLSLGLVLCVYSCLQLLVVTKDALHTCTGSSDAEQCEPFAAGNGQEGDTHNLLFHDASSQAHDSSVLALSADAVGRIPSITGVMLCVGDLVQGSAGKDGLKLDGDDEFIIPLTGDAQNSRVKSSSSSEPRRLSISQDSTSRRIAPAAVEDCEAGKPQYELVSKVQCSEVANPKQPLSTIATISQIARQWGPVVAAGVASGALGGLIGMWGPPVMMLFANSTLQPTAVRATAFCIGAVNVTTRLVTMILTSPYLQHHLQDYAGVALGTLLGATAGFVAHPRLTHSLLLFKTLLMAILLLCSLGLLASGIVQLLPTSAVEIQE